VTDLFRAAFVDPQPVPGGAQRALAVLADALPREGVGVVAVEPAELDGALRDPAVRVVVGMDAAGQLVGGPAAHRHRIPSVWWRHLTPRGRPDERAAARGPLDAVVCPTPRAAQLQHQLTPLVPVHCIPPGLPPPEGIGDPADVLDPLGWRGHPVVGMVARLDPMKGQDVFLHASATIVARRPDVRFVIVGGDTIGYPADLGAQLRALADALGISDVVHFTGHVEDPAPWFDAFEVFVQASLHESFGLALLEAMQRAVPVVATASDGPVHLLGEGAGMLVDAGSVPQVAHAVLDLLGRPDESERLGEQGRRRAAEFGATPMAARWAGVLRAVSRGPRDTDGSPAEAGLRPGVATPPRSGPGASVADR
jgi:glycosyltransferase involved in cell wall biosynthesis